MDFGNGFIGHFKGTHPNSNSKYKN